MAKIKRNEKKIFIKTFGCTLNQSDSELMAGLLDNAGYKILRNEKDKIKSDIIIINSCTVKQQAENKFFRELELLKKFNKKVVVAGCIAQAEPSYLKTELKDYSVIGTAQLFNIVKVVNSSLQGKVVHLIKKEKHQRLNLPKIRKNKIIEIIPICEGCVGNCVYCKVKQARGELFSYDTKSIKKQFEDAVKNDCKEIWLTAQDTGCYGLDINSSLPKLLSVLLEIDGDYRIRLGMLNPNFALKYLDSLIKIYKNPKVFKFLHIPVQSGNNRILKLMNRYYTVEDFKKIVKKFREQIPRITLSTDIIVGLPTEREKEFMNSMRLIRETKPDVLNISRFWLRPRTMAEKLKQVHGKFSKIRSEKVAKLFHKIAFEKNRKWLGWKGNVLIEGKGKNNTWIGRNDYYKQIVLDEKDNTYHLGERVKVKIRETTKYHLRGEIIA